jgi:hypothetical protein
MTKISEKEAKLVGYLINKVLVVKKTLNEEEMNQLKAILQKLDKIEKEHEEAEKKAIGLSEVIDNSMEKALIKLALKQSNALEFNTLPVKSKAQKLKEQIEALQNSQLGKFGEEQAKKEKERKEAEELDRYYEDWVSKNGRSL